MYGLLEKHKNKTSAFDGELRILGLHCIIADACPRWVQLQASLTELLQRAEECLDAELSRVSEVSRDTSVDNLPPMNGLTAMLDG